VIVENAGERPCHPALGAGARSVQPQKGTMRLGSGSRRRGAAAGGGMDARRGRPHIECRDLAPWCDRALPADPDHRPFRHGFPGTGPRRTWSTWRACSAASL